MPSSKTWRSTVCPATTASTAPPESLAGSSSTSRGSNPSKLPSWSIRWAEAKSNGYITRLQNGKASDVRRQISRIVNHVANEEDFGGRLARMRAKLVSGRYRNPIDLPALMMAPSDRTSTPSSPPGREEERVILVDKIYQTRKRAIWEEVRRRMASYQPRQIRRREGWWLIVRNVVTYLQAPRRRGPDLQGFPVRARGQPADGQGRPRRARRRRGPRQGPEAVRPGDRLHPAGPPRHGNSPGNLSSSAWKAAGTLMWGGVAAAGDDDLAARFYPCTSRSACSSGAILARLMEAGRNRN